MNQVLYSYCTVPVWHAQLYYQTSSSSSRATTRLVAQHRSAVRLQTLVYLVRVGSLEIWKFAAGIQIAQAVCGFQTNSARPDDETEKSQKQDALNDSFIHVRNRPLSSSPVEVVLGDAPAENSGEMIIIEGSLITSPLDVETTQGLHHKVEPITKSSVAAYCCKEGFAPRCRHQQYVLRMYYEQSTVPFLLLEVSAESTHSNIQLCLSVLSIELRPMWRGMRLRAAPLFYTSQSS